MARAATKARTHTGLYGKLWDRQELAARTGGPNFDDVAVLGVVETPESSKHVLFSRTLGVIHFNSEPLPKVYRLDHLRFTSRRPLAGLDKPLKHLVRVCLFLENFAVWRLRHQRDCACGLVLAELGDGRSKRSLGAGGNCELIALAQGTGRCRTDRPELDLFLRLVLVHHSSSSLRAHPFRLAQFRAANRQHPAYPSSAP
jgi:hypothetical protein